MTDAQLITEFLDGDSRAFNELIRRWQTPLHNFVCRFMGSDGDASDISQNVFLKVWQNLGSLQDRDRFPAWIFRIAANHCRDHIRSNSRIRIADADPESRTMPEDLPDRSVSVEHSLQAMDASRILSRSLQSLSEEQRLVIILKEYHGLKFIEIANILQESENTVKSRLYTGLKNLRKDLDARGIRREDIIHEMQ